ncbi:MAG TPA: hypothetical protein VLB27_02760, partial [candidate division Zixibacteria bacterium]|nr:hypothetical protein [candidate division Zixibacteria bacterium]
EQAPRQEGRRMNMVISPHAEVVRKAAKERAARVAEKERKKQSEREAQGKTAPIDESSEDLSEVESEMSVEETAEAKSDTQ